MLDAFNSTEIRHIKEDINTTYLSGGPGYVMNKIALIKLVEDGIRNETLNCNRNITIHEDLPVSTYYDFGMILRDFPINFSNDFFI